MNRLAVVLAADSATTVRQMNGGRVEERYFKGANKIFQLSNFHPVGLMIYNAADILSVPWEVVVKDFRSHLARKSFNDLSGYANEFFDYMGSSAKLFPAHVQKDRFLFTTKRIAAMIVDRAGKSGTTEAERRKALDDAIAARAADLAGKPVNDCIGQDVADAIPTTWHDEIRDTVMTWSESAFYPPDISPLCDVAIQEVLKNPGDWLPTTGLVFAGYGDADVFPSMIEFQSCGVVQGKHVAIPGQSLRIDHDMPAGLSAFAQTSMSDTFALGFSVDVFNSVNAALEAGLRKFATDLFAAAGLNPAPAVGTLDQLIESTRSAITDTVLDDANREHAYPLRQVLGFLPIDEMANLAETLIALQSLKEKVTKPSETVGGPVDVAVITRSEGLVWVKRKHFFDPTINSRYVQRQATTYSQ